MRRWRWLLAATLVLPLVAAAAPGRAQTPDITDEVFAFVMAQMQRADWGSAALRHCGGKVDEAAAAALPALQERVALTLLTRDWEPARSALEDYVACSFAALRLDALGEALDLRAQLERWNGAAFESRASRTLSNRLALAASLVYAADGRHGKQTEALVKLAEFQDLFDDTGIACKTLFLAGEAAARTDDPAATRRVREAAQRLACPPAR
ncbi:MAG: hypothetical protein AB7N54_12385 [Alphaproteobacteria bacterium]